MKECDHSSDSQFLQVLEELTFDSQIEVLNEISDFLQCGYSIIVKHFSRTGWYLKLRHRTNGNILVVRWCTSCYTINKNGKLVKSVTFPDELISD